MGPSLQSSTHPFILLLVSFLNFINCSFCKGFVLLSASFLKVRARRGLACLFKTWGYSLVNPSGQSLWTKMQWVHACSYYSKYL